MDCVRRLRRLAIVQVQQFVDLVFMLTFSAQAFGVCREFRAIVGENLLKNEPVAHIQRIEHLQCLEHHW